MQEALKQLEVAAQLAPKSGPIHTELATVLSTRNDFAGALSELSLATNLSPTYAEAHVRMGSVLLKERRISAALEEYHRALRLKPGSPEALDGFAWIRSTAPDANLRQGDQAVAAASRACELTGFGNSKFVLTLAAAYAENGEFDAAVRTAQQAAELALTQNDTRQEQFCRQLESDFRSRKPFRVEGKGVESLNR